MKFTKQKNNQHHQRQNIKDNFTPKITFYIKQIKNHLKNNFLYITMTEENIFNNETEENIFNNGVIYKIQCNDDNIKDFYIGSTVNFKKRIQRHKNICNDEKNKKHNFKVYQIIRQNGGFINWNFSIIENVSCNNKIELLTRERHFYDILKPSLNKIRPITSEYEKNEYYEVNKDKIKHNTKEYYKVNKDKLKEYREVNKDKLKEYNKEYNKANKDNKNEKYKKYYEANKNKIAEQRKEYYKATKDKLKTI